MHVCVWGGGGGDEIYRTLYQCFFTLPSVLLGKVFAISLQLLPASRIVFNLCSSAAVHGVLVLGFFAGAPGTAPPAAEEDEAPMPTPPPPLLLAGVFRFLFVVVGTGGKNCVGDVGLSISSSPGASLSSGAVDDSDSDCCWGCCCSCCCSSAGLMGRLDMVELGSSSISDKSQQWQCVGIKTSEDFCWQPGTREGTRQTWKGQ
jgi:hypothetical protein